MKTCFKCQLILPLYEFYHHPAMGDGHLGKCKDCTKTDTAARVAVLSKDPVWLEKEIERHRLKAERRRKLGLDKIPRHKKRASIKKYRLNHPQKHKAHLAVWKARLAKQPCGICGAINSQAHHEDYSRPLEVQWLCPKHHAERHRELRRLKRLAQPKPTP